MDCVEPLTVENGCIKVFQLKEWLDKHIKMHGDQGEVWAFECSINVSNKVIGLWGLNHNDVLLDVKGEQQCS